MPLGRTVATWLLVPALLSAIWLTLNADHFARPEIRAAYLAYLIAAPVLIGLYWWIRRPAQRLGRLLVIFGFAAWPLSLQASDDALLFTIGVASESVLAYLTFYLCLAFPRGRLSSSIDRRLMAGWALTLALSWAPWLFAVPRLQGGGPLSSCVIECPANAFQLQTIPQSTLLFIAPLGIAVTVVFASIIMGLQLLRLTFSSPPQRRALWPVTITTLLLLASFATYHLSRGLVPVEETAMAAIEAVYITAVIIFPLGFLASLVRADLFAAKASRRLMEGLAGVVSPNTLRESLSEALGDPDLRLGVWDVGRASYIEADGRLLSQVRPERGEVWVPVMSGSQSIAGIVADESLSSETALLAAASAATVVAINEETATEDAMVLRAQVVNATDSERQQIARDLHDSAQQRLVALRVKVSLASEQMDSLPVNQAALNRLGDELDDAIEDLRNVSRRFLAPSAVRGGIATAISSITRSWPIEVDVDDTGLGRHAPEVELCVYNCCLEALQNAFEHAGENATVTVRLTDIEGAVTFSVSDDGVGFDPSTTQPGAGLLGMADRALLAGGSLTVTAAPGLGVVVRGAIPDRGLEAPAAATLH